MKAVAYCRVSSKEQVGNTSLESQEQAIRAHCVREQLELVDVFHEMGESAKTADRTELQRLIGYCAERSVGVILVWKFDRFARDAYQHLQLRAQLQKLGVEVRSVTEPTSEDPAGRLMETMLAGFAQFDNEVRAQRAREGLRARASKGYWVSCPPIGYRVGREEGVLELDPARAQFVRQAFEQAATGGRTLEEIRRELTARGMRTPRGKKITAQTFHRMVHNPIYAGRVVLPKFGIDVRALFKPLVSPRLFAEVQAQLGGKPRRRSGAGEFPLRQFAFCDDCGGVYTGAVTRSKGHVYGYYRCQACTGTNVRRRALHDSFASQLELVALDRRMVPLVREIAVALFRRQHERRGVTAARLSRQLNDVGARERKLREAFIYERQIGADVYEQEMATINETRSGLECELRGLKSDVADPTEILHQVEPILVDPAGSWKRLAGPARRAFQRVSFPEGVPVREGAILKPPKSPIFSTLGAVQRGEIKRGSPNGI